MTSQLGKLLVIINAAFLVVAALGGFVTDIRGSFFGTGPEALLLNRAPGAGIGMMEAHGLAFIIAVTILAVGYGRRWHLMLMAIHLLLGTCNLMFWQFFVVSDMLTVGHVMTIGHWLFAAAHLVVLACRPRRQQIAKHLDSQWVVQSELGQNGYNLKRRIELSLDLCVHRGNLLFGGGAHMAKIIRKETRQRGFFGWAFLLLFVGFNIFMAYTMFAGLAAIGGRTPVTEAEKAGHVIGTVIGTSMILFLWACGAIVTGLLALLTRGKKVIVEETPG